MVLYIEKAWSGKKTNKTMNKIIFRLSLLIAGLLAGASVEASAWNRMNMIPNPTEVSDSTLTFEEAYSLAMQVDKEPKYKGLTLLKGTYMQTVEPEKQVLAKDLIKEWLLDFYKGNEFIKDENKVLKYLRGRYYLMSLFARMKEVYPFVKLTDWKYDFSDLYKMSSYITSRYQYEWNLYSEQSFNFDRAYKLLSKADTVLDLVNSFQKRLQQNYISNPSKKTELDQFVAAGYKEDNSTYVDYFKRLHGSTESMQVASGDSLNLYALAIYENKDMSDAEKKKLLYAICKDSEKGLQNEWAKANEYIKEKFYETYYATKKTPTLAALGINVDIEDGTLCWHPYDVDLREVYNAYKDLRMAEDNLNADLILSDRVIFEVYAQLINPLIEDKDVKKIVKKAGGSLYYNYKHYKDDDVQKELAIIDDEPIDFDNFSEDVVNAYKKSYAKRGDIKPLNYSEKTTKQYLYIALCELVSKDPVLSEKYPQCAKMLKADFTSAPLKQKVESCRSAYKKLLGGLDKVDLIKTNSFYSWVDDLSTKTNLPVDEERSNLAVEECRRILKENPEINNSYRTDSVGFKRWYLEKYEEFYNKTESMKITKEMFEDLFKIAYEKKMDLQYDTRYYTEAKWYPAKIIYYNDSIMYIKSVSTFHNEVKENIWYKLKDGRWCRRKYRNFDSDKMIIYSKDLTKEMIPFLGDETTSSDGRILVDVLGKRRIPIEMSGQFYKKEGLIERKNFSDTSSGESVRFLNAEFSFIQRPGEDINDYILARGTDYTAANGPKSFWDTMSFEEYKKLSDKVDDARERVKETENKASFIEKYSSYGREQAKRLYENGKKPFIGMSLDLFSEFFGLYPNSKDSFGNATVTNDVEIGDGGIVYKFYFRNGKLYKTDYYTY